MLKIIEDPINDALTVGLAMRIISGIFIKFIKFIIMKFKLFLGARNNKLGLKDLFQPLAISIV